MNLEVGAVEDPSRSEELSLDTGFRGPLCSSAAVILGSISGLPVRGLAVSGYVVTQHLSCARWCVRHWGTVLNTTEPLCSRRTCTPSLCTSSVRAKSAMRTSVRSTEETVDVEYKMLLPSVLLPVQHEPKVPMGHTGPPHPLSLLEPQIHSAWGQGLGDPVFE